MQYSESLNTETLICPACGEKRILLKFSLKVLNRYDAHYCECSKCCTLFISRPHWLDEAYGDETPDLDTGSVQRNIICSLYIIAMSRVGLLHPGAKIIDFGAGSGLTVRLLRDNGFNAFGYDKYTKMENSRDFRFSDPAQIDGANADLITAFEVFEHLPQPRAVLESIGRGLSENGMVLLTSQSYEPKYHDESWEYLARGGGQHVTFYSKPGLRALAERCGFEISFLPYGFHLLHRGPLSAGFIKRTCVWGISTAYFSLARILGMCTFHHSVQDMLRLQRKSKGDSEET